LYAKINDLAAGIATTDKFKKFSQTNYKFLRAFWNSLAPTQKTEVFFASYRMEATPHRGNGFSHRDFALRNTSWLISDIMAD
jgi:epoxyqueuosine reductase